MATPSEQEQTRIELRLYIAGQAPGCAAALANIRGICEEHFTHRYTLEVIDLLKEPLRGSEHQVVALPTLVRCNPKPLLRMVGNLAQKERVLTGILSVER